MSQVTTERRLWESVAIRLAALVRPLLGRGQGVAADRARAEMVSLTFAGCTAIFLTKAFIPSRALDPDAAPPQVWDGRAVATLTRVWGCCAEDFAVGLGCLVLARAA